MVEEGRSGRQGWFTLSEEEDRQLSFWMHTAGQGTHAHARKSPPRDPADYARHQQEGHKGPPGTCTT